MESSPELLWGRILPRAVFLTLAACCAAGCGLDLDRDPPIAKIPPPEVTISQPVERDLVELRQFPGRVEAKENVEIRARVTGYITEVNFVEGDIVEQGAVLFRIDSRPFDEVLKAAEADRDRWVALIAKNNADLDRQANLMKKGAGLQEDFDSAKAALLEAEASKNASEAAIERARLDVEFTTVKAPVKGRVGRALVTKGNLVSGDQTSGTPLTTLVSVDPMYVYFDVDELTVLEAQRDNRERNPDARNSRVRDQKRPVFIGLANETNFPHEGVIDFVDNRVDPETGTLRVRGHFDNADEYLSAGLFVKVQVPLGEPKSRILVPQNAVGTDLNQKYVMVVNEKNEVVKKPVELGTRTDDGLQVVESGLSPDDWVVVNGMQRAREGAPVNPTKTEIKSTKPVAEETPQPSADSASAEKPDGQ